MRPEQIKTVQARRIEFLQLAYTRAGADTRAQVNIEGLRCELGMDQRELESVFNYWVAKGCITMKTGSTLRISQAGIDEAERSFVPAEKPATTNGHVIHAHTIINSPIQQGTTKSTQTVSFGPGVEAGIREVLARLKAELPGAELEPEDRGEAVCDIQTVETQLESPRPKVSIIRASLAALYDVSLKVTGGVITNEIAPKIHHLLQQLPHFHP